MALLIDTAVAPARERLEFWSECSCNAYHPLQIRSPAAERFWARMRGDELGPLSVFRISAAANTMIRTSGAIAAGDPECLHVGVVLRGRLNGAQEGRTGVARVGDVITYETSRPAVFRADRPFEILVLRVPRLLLGRQAAQIAGLTAVPIAGGKGAPQAAATSFRRLAGELETGAMGADEVGDAVDRALDLVRSVYAGPGGANGPARMRSRAEILLGIESYIDSNLGDPDLDPDEIARASFISRRYLHKLFEAEGTSVCRWIRDSRLERCHADLLDPALGHQTILAIASRWGLPCPQHFSRLFREAYGCSPSELRREARRDAADAAANRASDGGGGAEAAWRSPFAALLPAG